MHLIDTSNNRNNMAYIGKTPWHGLGQKVNPNTTIEEWRIAAGLDWKIERRDAHYTALDSYGCTLNRTVPNRKVLVRSDTQAALSIVSDRYKVVQPADVLEFYRDLVDGSQFTIETAGSLKGGAKIWALAKGNDDLRIKGNDVVSPYLLLATACDGTMSTVADFTTVRVVCQNTLTMAVGANGREGAIRVPHSTTFDPAAVKAQLGLADKAFFNFSQDAIALAHRPMTERETVEYFFDLYAAKDDDGNITNEASAKRIVTELLTAYNRGPGAEFASAKGTAWGAVNAVTNYEDFTKTSRSDENRFNSAQFGPGAKRKAAAFDAALKLVA